jgi:acyl carrier protein
MPSRTYADLVSLIRSEVSRYYDGNYGDDDDFIRDLRIASDDMSAVVIAIEKRLGVHLNYDDYQNVWSVNSYARLLYSRLNAPSLPGKR